MEILNVLPDDATGDMLRRMRELGDDLSRPRAIDFAVVLPTESAAGVFARHFASVGFAVKLEHADAAPGLPWDVIVVRHMVPEYDAIIAFEWELDEIAEPLGGRNDGWGCFEPREPAPPKPRIVVKLERDADGYPPCSIERLGATPVGDGLFKIENAPYFATNIAYGDVVRAVPTDRPGQFAFEGVIERSDYTALAIVVRDDNTDALIARLFRGLDCVVEHGAFGTHRVVAVAIPGTASYGNIRSGLQFLEARNLISVHELAVAGR